MAKNSFVAKVTFNLPLDGKYLYRVAHRLVFSQNVIPYLSVATYCMCVCQNIYQLCQHKLLFSWKYLVFVVEMISSSNKNIANPEGKCAKYHFFVLGSLTNSCLIYIKTVKYYPFVILPDIVIGSVIVFPLLNCFSLK